MARRMNTRTSHYSILHSQSFLVLYPTLQTQAGACRSGAKPANENRSTECADGTAGLEIFGGSRTHRAGGWIASQGSRPDCANARSSATCCSGAARPVLPGSRTNGGRVARKLMRFVMVRALDVYLTFGEMNKRRANDRVRYWEEVE